MRKTTLLALLTLLALSAMSQDMVLVGSRVRVATDTLFLPITTDVDLLDLRGPVDSVQVKRTFFEDSSEWADMRTYRFDSHGYYASRTFPVGSAMNMVSYTNTYRRGRLQQVEIVDAGEQGGCRRLLYRYDLSGNVIGNVIDCADTTLILSTTIYDRFRNPLYMNKQHSVAKTFSYRYDPMRPGQAITSTCIEADRLSGDSLFYDTRYVYTTEGYIARTVTVGPTEGRTKTVDYIYDANHRLIIKETVDNGTRIVDTYTRDYRGSLLTHTQRVNGTLVMRAEYSITYR